MEARGVRPAVDQKTGERLSRVQQQHPTLRDGALDVAILKPLHEARSVLQSSDHQESLASIQTCAEKLTDDVDEERFVLVEVDEVMTVSSGRKQRPPPLLDRRVVARHCSYRSKIRTLDPKQIHVKSGQSATIPRRH